MTPPLAPVPAEPPAAPPDDEQLVASARDGDLAAFNELVTRHERAAYALAVRLLGDRAAAQDATQDAFLSAWSHLQGYRGGRFKPWMLRIVANRCYDELRRRQRQPSDSLDALPVEPEGAWTLRPPAEAPDDFALRRELSHRLRRGIDGLPPDQRLTLILADVHGHAYDEIAAITGATLGTVKSRLSRARAKLRDDLRDDRELLDRYLRQIDDGRR